jgi:hypothetical protein
MKKVNRITFTLALCLITHLGLGQNSFNNCSAIFLNNKMIVDEYTTEGKCSLFVDAKGDLTVSTVELSSKENKAVTPILFQVAIRDKNTGTLMLVSKEKTEKIEIEKVLAKCKKGDYIIILTMSDEYALPHNAILIQ